MKPPQALAPVSLSPTQEPAGEQSPLLPKAPELPLGSPHPHRVPNLDRAQMAPHPCCPPACRPVGHRCAVCWHMGPAGGEANKASALILPCGLLRRSHVPHRGTAAADTPEPLLDYIPPRGRAWPEATQQARGPGLCSALPPERPALPRDRVRKEAGPQEAARGQEF